MGPIRVLLDEPLASKQGSNLQQKDALTMKIELINGKKYRLPGGLNKFQRRLYVHLINWKWANITAEPGTYNYGGNPILYDAILPAELVEELRIIYPSVREELRRHQRTNRFRLHTHFNHMASSQAANVNLFLPVLRHPLCNKVLATLKPDFASLATDHLDRGYCLEFWGGNFGGPVGARGPLGDKSALSGTDSDIAIAYRNHAGELCLWLIEHKLTEREFTTCGGFKSKDRKKAACDCERSASDILEDKKLCFHHAVRERKYWDVTENNMAFFVNHESHAQCPFQRGMNQLWRNQLLALAMKQEGPYQHATFSVVTHPANHQLDETLNAFKKLVNRNPGFSVFTSKDVMHAAETLQDEALTRWTAWYRSLYGLEMES